MKIGIITFHRATNCGAALQTFGLFKFLKNNGHNVEIVDFIPNDLAYAKRGKMHNILHITKMLLMPVESKRQKHKEKAFNDFIKKHLILSNNKYLGDRDIEKDICDYDLLISGSDQILNTSLTGESKAYYLHFSNIKKISYASSFGRTDISEIEKKLIKEYLIKFDAISVRESSAIQIIDSLIKKCPTLVCDPVFLLSRDEWTSMVSYEIDKKKEYIFIYLMEDSDITDAAIDAIKSKFNIPLITVIGGRVSKKYSNTDFSCGPEQFINYIYNAKVVMTNSFHASAFSIIFGKEFYTIAHSCRNSRLENLFRLINENDKLINRVIKKNELNKYLVSGKCAYSQIVNLIENSKDFLINNIGF